MGVAARIAGDRVTDVLVVGGVFREVVDADSDPKLRYGGSGLTAAVTAARIECRVALASYVGSDDEEAVRAELLLAGVDDGPLLTVSGASGTFVFPTEEVPTRPWPMYRPAESIPQQSPLVPEAAVVLAFGIPDFDPVGDGWLRSMLPTTTLIWDRQGWLSRARNADAIIGLPAARKIYLANEAEANEDAEAKGVTRSPAPQPPDGFDVSVIKRGIEGVDVYFRDGLYCHYDHIPTFAVHTVSTIGSGDVFAGAFAGRIAQGDSPASAAKWGCAAASIALQTNDCLLRNSNSESIAALVGSRWM